MIRLEEIKFERTVWAEKQLAKLCPNNDMKQINVVLQGDDTEKQFNMMEDLVIIMHQAYERKQKFLGNDYEPIEIGREYLDNLNEDELSQLAVRAFGDFKKDGQTLIEAEPKKEEAEVQTQTKSS